MIPVGEWNGKNVGVLGLARSGVALARVLGGLGARVLVSDTRPEPAVAEAATEARRVGAEVETGGHSARLFEVDALIVSPGVSVHSEVVQQLLARGIPVLGEVEVAYLLCPLPIVAVTGTNGKSTTCSLIHQCLMPRALLAGNIGVPLVSEVSNDLSAYDWVVAEISSFQLETTHTFAPKVAVLTNVTPDHLDRHRTMEEYVAAKARLFSCQGAQDWAIFNADDEGAARVGQWLAEGRLPAWLPGFASSPNQTRPTIVSYSALHPVDDGCFFDGRHLVFRHQGQEETLMDWNFPNLPGPHNLSNALAAALVARLLSVPTSRIIEVFSAYGRLHHRLELVDTIQGVRFIDDSKATNVSSVEAALQTYTDPSVLIAGGRDKGLELDLLGSVIAKHAHGLVVIGEAAESIAAASRQAGLERIVSAGSMEDAVAKAYRLCPSPGVVLLSPACTSFDMFNNAEHRGEVFHAAVETLRTSMGRANQRLGEEGE